MKNLSVAVVHNVPAPYRLYLFDALNREATNRGVDFSVHFLSNARGDRAHWACESFEFKFPSRLWMDYSPANQSVYGQFNPGLVSHLWRRRYDYVIVGGITSSWTAMVLSVLGCRARCEQLAWMELYRLGPRPRSRLKRAVLRWLMNRYSRFVVPGSDAVLTVERQGYGNAARCILLPNLVDECRFAPSRLRDQGPSRIASNHLAKSPGRLLAICPARLIPEKGIVPFLKALTPEILKGWDLVFIGDGPLRLSIENEICVKNLQDHVRIASTLAYDEMPSVLALADLFVLPSLRDQNPLAVVEALWSGLPILLSSRVGNYPEAINVRENGWGFDPNDPREIEHAARSTTQCFEKSPLNHGGGKPRQGENPLGYGRVCLAVFLDSPRRSKWGTNVIQ